ncbi:MAG: dehydrogenase, partial [Prevotella sp.]|nr:dehydrogenase [Prevotella sp.]
DALNGRIIWETPVQGKRFNINDKHFDGGFYASPLLGKGNCNGFIFTNCVINKKRQNGDFIAFDRKTGAIAYRTHLKHYAWSSPVGFTNEKDEMFIFTGDTFGNVYLINGIDGKIIYTCRVGENFESSPVVIDNHVVVGSRGRSIFKMTIK